MQSTSLVEWLRKDDPLSAFLMRHGWPIVLLFAPMFAVTYFPAPYAIPFPIWDKWWWAIHYVAYLCIALQILRHRNLVPWLSTIGLLLLYFWVSSSLTDQAPDWGTLNFHLIMDIGFVSLTAYVFSLKREPALLAFLVPGIVMSCINFYTFFVYRDMPAAMAGGIASYDQTQIWFFFTHDNGSFFITFPTVVLFLYYGLAVRKSLRWVAVAYSGIVAAIYIWMFSVAAMFGFTLLFLAGVGALVLQQNTSRTFSSNLYVILLALGLAFSVLMVVANVSDVLPGMVAFLGKSSTIAMRQVIWRASLKFFQSYPLTGIGLLSNHANEVNITITHCHNIVLQMLYTGGVVTLAAFIVNLLSFWRRGRRVSPAVALLYVSVFVYLLVGTFDFYDYFPFGFGILFMLYVASADLPAGTTADASRFGNRSEATPTPQPEPAPRGSHFKS
jgi:O-antigen ligase